MLEVDALMRALESISPDVFTIAKFHSTDWPPVHSPLYYLSAGEFGDRVSNGDFATYSAFPERSSGILKQTIMAGTAAKRIVLILEADVRTVQQPKDWHGWDARYVFVTPPSADVAERRWRPGHMESGQVQICEEMRQSMGALRRAPLLEATDRMERAELEHAMAVPETYDLILQSTDLDDALRSLVALIWRPDYRM